MLSAGDVARRLNEAGVHVAVNLDGWTSMGRTNDVFALAPAPVQARLWWGVAWWR